MLNIKLRALALLPLLAASAAQAVEDTQPAFDWYVQSTLGMAKSRATVGDLNNRFAQAGLNASVTGFDDTDIGYGLALGYQWHNNWSVELGLRNLGEFAIDITAQAENPQVLYNTIENLHPESAKGAFVALNYRLLFGERWSAAAKIGALSWRGDYDTKLINSDETHVGDEKQTGTDEFFGLATYFHFNPRWQTGIGWERYQFDNHDVDYVHLGLTYRFGGQHPTRPTVTAEPQPKAVAMPLPTVPPQSIARTDCEVFSGALQGVNFANNSADLTEAAQQSLMTAIDVLTRYPQIKVNIQAHTDAIGGEEANRVLSEARAKAVRNFFIEQQINPGRLTASGFGELFPIQDNATPLGRAANRRVELKLLNPEACAQP